VFVLVGSLCAQDLVPPPPEGGKAAGDGAQESPAKPPPPKAQVIEEDKSEPEVKSDGGEKNPKPDKIDTPDTPASTSEDATNQVAPTTATPTDVKNDNQGGVTPPDQEMPPLSEMTPLTPKVDKPANEGIQIQVEKFNGKSGQGSHKGKVKVTSPWPAKPLDAPPLGWRYIPAPTGIEPYRTTIKLGGDNSVNLAITPYVLVPVSDGRNVIRIAEPGYDPAQGYRQETTIGSILQHSTEEIEYHEKLTSAAIQRLQSLLSSLPQP